MKKEMKTIYRIVALFVVVCIFFVAYLISPQRNGNAIINYDHSNNRLPLPENTDQYLTEEIGNKHHMAIESDWNKFLGRKDAIPSKDDEDENEREEEEEEEAHKIDGKKEDEDDEWENYLNKHPTAKHSKSVTHHLPRHVQEEKTDHRRVTLNKKLKRIMQKKAKLKMKIILIYTGLHKNSHWYNLPKNATKGYLKRTKCKQWKCHVTYDKELIPLADAVVFHERNMPSVDMLNMLSQPETRPAYQRWIYFTSETPKNSATNAIPYDGFFNWTMTYRTNSDIYLPYLQYRALAKNEKPPAIINYAKTKNGTIAWLVGNCDFGFRMKFATLLEREAKIYVGGGCREHFKERLDCTPWCHLDTLKTYKFYLSFENGICTDYITEKYWRYLELGLVPVVLGGANYSDSRLAIPGSYIDASAFGSVQKLARYLEYLDKNDTAYNEYFKWKQKYKIWHPPSGGDWPFESYFLCEICQKLHQNLPKKVYKRLSDFWNIHTDCQMPEDELFDRFIPKDFDKGMLDEEEIERMKHSKDKIPKDFDEE